MVRTTIVLPEEDFRELKALAEARHCSISWLLRDALRRSKSILQRPEFFAQSFDLVWDDIGVTLRNAGVKPAGVPRLIGAVLKRRAPASTGKPR